jgi:hypothetical protein
MRVNPLQTRDRANGVFFARSFYMASCARSNRRVTLSLVLASAACLGSAAALWRPAAAPLDENLVVVERDDPPSDTLREDEESVVMWPGAWSGLDASVESATPVHVYFMYAEPAVAMRRAWLRSLFGWLFALVSMALAAGALGRLRAARRTLPLAARPARPVPIVMLLSLVLPMLPQLVLMHADTQLLPSLLLLVAAAGVGTAGAMLAGRRQLTARLRWAVDGPLASLADGTLVAAEVEARKLALPAGYKGRAPWYRADLLATANGEPVRVALDGALVDARAAREIASVTFAGPTGSKLTVLAATQRVPADAVSADPLSRAPTQPRLAGSAAQPTVVFAGTRAEFARRIRQESALLVGVLLVSLGAAILALT